MKGFVTALICFLVGPAAATAGDSGVVVESVGSGGAAAKAGLVSGDVLVEWIRAPAPPADPDVVSGIFRSPFDVREVEIEHGSRAAVTISGRRGDRPLTIEIGAGRWGLEVRPALAGKTEARYLEAAEAIESGNPGGGVDGLEHLAGDAVANNDRIVAAWFLKRAAEVLESSDNRERQGSLLREAVRLAQASGNSEVEAQTHVLLGEALKAEGRLVDAEHAHRRALELREKRVPDSLIVAASLNYLGSVVWRQGDLERAKAIWERSHEIRSRLAPGSIEEAASLNNLAILALDRGDLDTADEIFNRSLDIIERLQPDSALVARSLNNLVLLAHHRGDLVTAEQRARRAVAIGERLDPDGFDLGMSLNNLGIVLLTRGDLGAAERIWRRTADIFESTAPTSLELAATVNNLALVAFARGDLEAAEDLQQRALSLRKQIAPESLDTAMSFEILGSIVADRGDAEAADGYARRALAMRRKVAPESLDVTVSLVQLGEQALDRGDLDTAEGRFLEAFELRSKLAPGSQLVAEVDHKLGRVEMRRGHLEKAEKHFRDALSIRQVLTPGTDNEVQTLHALGVVLWQRGRIEAAAEMLARAVAALETERAHRGGALEHRGLVRSRELAVYHDLMRLLVETGRPAEAFAILERSRAQGLLSILAERDLAFSADIPFELDHERRMTAAAADRVLEELGSLSVLADTGAAHDQRGVGGLVATERLEHREELLAELRRLRNRQEEIRTRIRAESPRLASLTAPQPLDLAGTLSMLDRGTVLLAYAVGERECHLFIIEKDRGTISVVRLGVGSQDLRTSVLNFRAGLQNPSRDTEALGLLALDLGADLLAPAATAIGRARRLVIVPDGPLHLVPFSALMVRTDGESRFLVELKPASVVASATLLGELKKGRRTGRTPRVVAFADPRYTGKEGVEALPIVADRRAGLDLRPLPFTKREAENLATIYGPGTEIWLGAEASEERAKRVGPDATIVHFATHAFVSEQLPLESAIALSPPSDPSAPGNNGLLQTWEVLEQVRLDADLVTLSGCSTALGKEATGEGLIGLTRAFQYAGARSVLASLWSVADESTAVLMDRFYRRLRSGSPPDEALRAAQLDLFGAPLELEGPGDERHTLDARHPFHWAAFEVIGDWR